MGKSFAVVIRVWPFLNSEYEFGIPEPDLKVVLGSIKGLLRFMYKIDSDIKGVDVYKASKVSFFRDIKV